MTTEKKLQQYFVQQHGQSDCGPACLLSVIKYHGGFTSLDEIRRITGTTKTGTRLLGLYQGAQQLGFTVSGLEAEAIDNLKELDQPAILHVILENRLQHYVVFYGFRSEKIIIGNPAKGIEEWSYKKLETVWKSKSLLKLAPNDSFKTNDHRSKSKGYTELLEWVKEDFNVLIASLFLGLLVAMLSLSTAVFSQKLIDVILPLEDMVKLIVGLTLFGFILLAKSGLGYVRSTFLISQSKDFNNRMISSFFASLLKLPKPFFDSKKTGEMIARMNDTRRIQAAISNLAGNLLIEALVVVVSLIGVYVYSYQVGILVSCFLPVYLLILYQTHHPIISAQKGVMEAYALNEGNYIDVVSGIEAVKSTNRANLFHKLSTLIYQNFQENVFKLGKVQVRFNLLTELSGVALILSVISLSAYMVLQSELLLGSVIALLSLSGTIGPSMVRIALFNIQLQEARIAYDRMKEFTGLGTENFDGESLPKNADTLEMRNVSFHYPGSLDLLVNVNLSIRKGSITALIGESGSGKSTILQLLQRFHAPTTGEILINDVSIFSFQLDEYRRKIGVIPQEVKIFNNYLLFNIALSEEEKTLEEVVQWCKETGFHKFFSKFPQGYVTLIGEEGINISGGQKQLVGLARALFSKPQFLLVDEGTSAMDSETEKFVLDLLQKVKNEMGVLIVTHREKVAYTSDQLFRLENGKVKQEY
ncbi:MAG: peptidase domain-containing ABC transporter [Bacteroidota bacterium]